MIVLGLSGGFHFGSCDAAATLMRDGEVLAFVEEERLTRNKHSFSTPPTRCIKSVLETGDLRIDQVDCIAVSVETYPETRRELSEHLSALFGHCPPIELVNHHLAHAASAFYPSGFDAATVITFDWSGDGISTSIWTGNKGDLTMVEQIARPNSLGAFYAAFTQFLGFERGDEYKVMGLASYGRPGTDLDPVLDVSGETYVLNEEMLNPDNRNMHQSVFSDLLDRLYPGLRRSRWQTLTQAHKDLAASVQSQFERAVFNVVGHAIGKTGLPRLAIAGGCGMNCSANGKLVLERRADEVYLPPFPHDAGTSYGAAAVVCAKAGVSPRPLASSQLGPGWDDETIGRELELLRCPARRETNVTEVVADAIVEGKLVGWYQGRMEAGPRALGGRSILADPRDPSVKDRINTYVKFRETFRPFAPSVLEPAAGKYFDFPQASPFMSFVAPVKTPDALPGITHIDGTARLQTVADNGHPYARLLNDLEQRTSYPVVLNTSFNYMGQPIVCTPKEAIYTFFGTGLDMLAIGDWIVTKPGLR